MDEGIQVVVGLETVDGWLGMEYRLFDDGVRISSGRKPEDLMAAIAVLRDVADALEFRLNCIQDDSLPIDAQSVMQ